MELDNNQSLDSLVNDKPVDTGPAPGPNPVPGSAPVDTPPSFEPNPISAPSMPDSNVPIIDKPAKLGNKAIIIAMIFAVIVALGGIGFGIFQMNAVSKKDSEIKNLKTQIANLANVSSEEASPADSITSLPIIKSDDSTTPYSITFSSVGTKSDGSLVTIATTIKEGKIASCQMQTKTAAGETSDWETCTIKGLDDADIYKGIQVMQGQAVSDMPILFLMTNGTVRYVLPSEFYETKEVTVKNEVETISPVTDIVTISAGEGAGSGADTVLVLSDGTIAKYDQSLITSSN